MEIKESKEATLINMDKGDKLLVNHKGSVRFIEIIVDETDDIIVLSKLNFKGENK